MNLRGMLAGVREHEYRHTAGKDQPAQVHLRTVRRELTKMVPTGMRVLVSGSGQSLPVVPWIAVLDPDVTSTAKKGTYVVYLYRHDLTQVYLSVNQGATQRFENAKLRGLSPKNAENAAVRELRDERTALLGQISKSLVKGLLEEIELAAPRRFLPEGYEAGNIVATSYDVARLPDEEVLRADLDRMLALQQICVAIKKDILAKESGLLSTPATKTAPSSATTPHTPIFRPKSSADYWANVPEQTQKKSRRHEALLDEFGSWIKNCGLTAATNVHPRDLTVDADGQHWLIEAKTVQANAELAVREAIGQLLAYRHFYYRKKGIPDPLLVALFTEPVGGALVALLNSIDIESIWHENGAWTSSPPNPATSLCGIAHAKATY